MASCSTHVNRMCDADNDVVCATLKSCSHKYLCGQRTAGACSMSVEGTVRMLVLVAQPAKAARSWVLTNLRVKHTIASDGHTDACTVVDA